MVKVAELEIAERKKEAFIINNISKSNAREPMEAKWYGLKSPNAWI